MLTPIEYFFCLGYLSKRFTFLKQEDLSLRIPIVVGHTRDTVYTSQTCAKRVDYRHLSLQEHIQPCPINSPVEWKACETGTGIHAWTTSLLSRSLAEGLVCVCVCRCVRACAFV